MAERVAALEQQNMGHKDWFMRGEAAAGEDFTLPCAEHCHLARPATGVYGVVGHKPP